MTSTETLQKLLESDFAAHNIVLSRTFVVNRKHYAKVVGVGHAYLGKIAAPLFLKYDAAVEARVVEAIEAFLRKHAADGTMIFHRGEVSRSWIREKFGLTARQTTSIKLRKILLEYDQLASTHDSSQLDLVKRLQACLESPAFPKSKSGLTVAARAVATKIGVHPSKLNNEPFRSIISEQNIKLASGKYLLPGEVIVAGTLRSFRSLFPKWNEQFIARVAACFQSLHDGTQHAAPLYFRTLKGVLDWIAASKRAPVRGAYKVLNAGKIPDQALWGNLWTTLLSDIKTRDKGLKESSQNNTLRTLENIFNDFSRIGLFPDLPYPTAKFSARVVSAKTRHHPTVAEARSQHTTDAERIAGQATELVSSILKENLDKSEFESTETENFLEVLKHEVIGNRYPLPAEIPEAVKTILGKRLRLITEAARAIVAKSQAYLTLGAQLLEETAFNQTALDEILAADSEFKRSELVWKWFPSQTDDENRPSILANLLAITRLRYEGIVPSVATGNHLDLPGLHTSRFRALTSQYGGRPAVMRYLVPEGHAVVAALVDYMVAAGANQAVAISLPVNCIQQSESKGHVTVTGIKLRAEGKPIRNEFHQNADVIRNLTWLQKSLSYYRGRADDETQQLLGIFPWGVSVRPISANYFRIAFAKIINEIPELTGLRITPGMIRRSVVVLERLSSTDSRTSAAVANHSRAINQIYNSTFPVRVQKNLRMRGFLDGVESMLIVQAAELVGTLEGQQAFDLEVHKQRLVSTGLGPMCKDPFLKPGSEGTKCVEPNCAASLCPQMDVRLYPDEVARYQIWRLVLTKAQPDWERDRPERWFDTWFPFLCLIEVIEQKCSRGVLLEAWDAGTDLRKQIESDPNYKEPALW